MKRCPTCNRTYADDGFTFCLNDGALLSAPYDPAKEKPVSTIHSSGPPPTAVLPVDNKTGDPSRPSETDGSQLAPTIASPGAAWDPQDANQFVHPQHNPSTVSKKRLVRLIAISVFVVIVATGAIYMFGPGRSNCPALLLRCTSDAKRTECYVTQDEHSPASQYDRPISAALCSLRPALGLQMPALPTGISKITWSASSGTIVTQDTWLILDTTGLSGKEISVRAAISGDNKSCSETIPNTFVVPPSADPLQRASPNTGNGPGIGGNRP